MKAVTLDGKTIEEYLRKIKGFVDELAGVGVPIRHEEYVDVLLKGLSSGYAWWFLLSKAKNEFCMDMKLDSCATTKKHM